MHTPKRFSILKNILLHRATLDAHFSHLGL